MDAVAEDAVAQDAKPGADLEGAADGGNGVEPGDGSAPGTAQESRLRPTWKDPVVLLAAALVLVPAVAAMASAPLTCSSHPARL